EVGTDIVDAHFTSIYAAGAWDRRIAFLDGLVDFTALTEVYQPGEIAGFLNENFELIGWNVEENSGEILKFMGDSVLAIFPT
ncbi:hypothetical protein ACC759_38150, partial [Rhizobium ruizarguesonis]